MGMLRLLSIKHGIEKNHRDVSQQRLHAPKPWLQNTCWYCNEPLDNSRRYCDKGCAEAFEEDDTAMARYVSDNRMHLSM